MKRIKTIFVSFLLIVVSSSAYSITIYSRTTEGGGVNGYNYTSKSSFTVYLPIPGLSPYFWPGVTFTDILCQNAGYSSCPSSIGPNEPGYDVTDISEINQLVAYADDNILNESLNGNHSVLVQVTGESFLRRYTVLWNVENGISNVEVLLDAL